MKAKRKGIRNRLVVTVLLVTVASFVLSTGVLIVRYASQSRMASEELEGARVLAVAQRIGERMRQRMELAQALAHAASGMSAESASADTAVFTRIARQIVARQLGVQSLWVSLDYRYLQSNVDSTNEAAFLHLRYVRAGNGTARHDTLVLSGNEQYDLLRDGERTRVLPPICTADRSDEEFPFQLTFTAPIFDRNGRSMGIVGIDFPLQECHTEAQRAAPLKGSYSMLLAGNFSIVSHPNTSNILQPFEKVHTSLPNWKDVMDAMEEGDTLRIPYLNATSRQIQLLFSAPIEFTQYDAPWTYCEVVPLSSLMAPAADSLRLVILVTVLGLAFLVLMLVVIANRLSRPLTLANESLRQISKGNLDESLRLRITRRDELGEIARSTNYLLEGLRDKAQFAEAIGRGDLAASYAADEGDTLGQSLKAMQASLRAASKREEEQRRVENQQAWATRGVAEFSELFRKNTDSIETFSYQMLHALVEYVGANVGAVFLLEEEGSEKSFRLAAGYAYEVRRYKQMRVRVGEGLVGRCGLEKKRILLTDIPPDYVRIASGLGQSTPRALLLVPMMVNEELVGVLEIASFAPFEEYAVRFIESIAGTFASTLLTVRGNQRTQRLLQEAQQKSKAMREQEDVLMQNLEELRTIQEENEQQKAIMASLEHAVREACYVAEFSREARMMRVNDEFLAAVRASRDEMIGTHASEFLSLHQGIARDFTRFWDEVLAGATKRQVRIEMIFRNERFYFIETYAPIYDEGGMVTGVLRIGYPAPVEGGGGDA